MSLIRVEETSSCDDDTQIHSLMFTTQSTQFQSQKGLWSFKLQQLCRSWVFWIFSLWAMYTRELLSVCDLIPENEMPSDGVSSSQAGLKCPLLGTYFAVYG
jgi:hypothetical protein